MPETSIHQPSPFDGMAADYDDSFTNSLIGRLMREAVWGRMDATFQPGQHVIELSCGTGEDAIHMARRGVSVLATDISAGMVATARAKVERAGLGHRVEVQRLDMAQVTTIGRRDEGDSGALLAYDGALSNFGGLNCVADLRTVAVGLAGALRPGGTAMLCVMGPLVPWEWAWYLRRGAAGRAFRRLWPGGTAWRGITITYPSISTLRRAFAPWFVERRVSAVGALIPPSYVELWAAERPLLTWALARIERRWEQAPPLAWLADHYLIELERLA